jgi:hypothetical protein
MKVGRSDGRDVGIHLPRPFEERRELLAELLIPVDVRVRGFDAVQHRDRRIVVVRGETVRRMRRDRDATLGVHIGDRIGG